MISKELISAIQNAKRPIFIWGAGVRRYAKQALHLARALGIPVATTWGAIDCIAHDDPLMAGGFGTHGTRAANFAVQNADVAISLGSRLDTKATGDPKTFVRGGQIFMVDIDVHEQRKFDRLGRIVIPIEQDAGEFIESMEPAIDKYQTYAYERIQWKKQIIEWRQLYDTPKVTWPGINPYEFVKELGKYTTADDIICSDTGTALGYMMQGFPFKGERFLHAFNMTPMGYGLPAAVGAALAGTERQRVILITGDGSFMMSLAEMATVTRWNLNIKIILLNNGGHAMCRQTERQWFGGKHQSTTVESGLGFPNWDNVNPFFGIERFSALVRMFSHNRPGFMVVDIHPDAYLIPQARFGAPIEDQEPLLPRDEFRAQMIGAEPIT